MGKKSFSGSSLACSIGNLVPSMSSRVSGRPARVSCVHLGANPLSCLDLLRLWVPPGHPSKPVSKTCMPDPGGFPLPHQLWSRSSLGSALPSPSKPLLRADWTKECSLHPRNCHVFPRSLTKILFCSFQCSLCSSGRRYRSWGQG